MTTPTAHQQPFTIEHHGALVIIHPLTDEAWASLEEHVPLDALWWNNESVVGPRYIADFILGPSRHTGR